MAGPPQIPLVLSVGVTGHRADMVPDRAIDPLRDCISRTLALIAAAGRDLLERHGDLFAPGNCRLRLVSPLADGADQIVAEVALALGWELQAILPFERSVYRETLASDDSRKHFDGLIERAERVLELPGDSCEGFDAYVMTGRATVAHCDMLIAIWDGRPPRGRGGTAEVVQLALTRGTAIVHVPLQSDDPARILWSGFDPAVLTVADEPNVARPLDQTNVEALIGALLLPPADQQERRFLRQFQCASGCAASGPGSNILCF